MTFDIVKCYDGQTRFRAQGVRSGVVVWQGPYRDTVNECRMDIALKTLGRLN